MKGQSSIEFMILIGAVLFFFLGFLYIIQISIADKVIEQKRVAVLQVASTVQEEINLAVTSSDGYSRTFILPQEIYGTDYSILLVSGSVYVNTSDGKHALALPVANVTGNVQRGDNLIRNVHGEVFLNS